MLNCPPISVSLSKRVTLWPRLAAVVAKASPAGLNTHTHTHTHTERPYSTVHFYLRHGNKWKRICIFGLCVESP